MEIYSKINVILLPANNIRSISHGSKSHFDFQVLLFDKHKYKATVAIDSDFSEKYQQCTLNTFWKGFIILDVIKNICDSE